VTAPQPEEEPKVVIRDRRRIDPETGELRKTAEAAAAGPSPAAGADAAVEPVVEADADQLQLELAERTADLQRVTAEYANYRRRVERDRTVAAEQATAAVLTVLLPVLDDLDRARSHGDLTGAFAAVAEQLGATLERIGLTAFGAAGDGFDPVWHEAVLHTESADVTAPTCVDVMRRGYAFGERMLRPAMVAVAEPSAEAQSGQVPDVPAAGTQAPQDTPPDAE
jgi:molecular chaperone GrpE